MKRFAVNPIKFNILQPRKQIENNQNDYSQNRLSVLSPLTKDTFSFCGKIPSIVTPTMEDLVNRTKAVDVLRFNILRLAKYDIPCPCCGHIMLPVDKFNEFEEKILSTTDPTEILRHIKSLKRYLHPVESKIFSMMESKNHDNPNMTLLEMLREKLPKSEKKIIHEQSAILTNIGIMSRDLPPEKSTAIKDLINETYTRIFDNRETSRFGRRVFIGKLQAILDINNTQDKTAQKIIAEAAKLPMAYNNPDAFIVKYAKRNYHGANADQKIALRMLSNSLATIEHIKPSKLNGETRPENLALECACDNNRRNHESVLTQILQNPSMIINYNRYMTRLVELHKQGKLEKSYIAQTNRTYSSASAGILDADLSALRNETTQKTKKTDSGITLTRDERRKLRHAKAKLIKSRKAVKKRNNKY